MRLVAIRSFIALGFIALCSCQSATADYSQADLDAAETEVAAELEGFWEAWSAASIDEGMAFYSDSPDGSFVNDGVIWESIGAANAAYRPFFDQIERQEFDIKETRLLALTPTVVHATIDVSLIQFFRNGIISGESRIGFTMTWVKEGGEWKALTYHFSTVRPAPATMKSVHLLNLPANTTETMLVDALNQANAGVREAGYENAGYDLWKIAETETPSATSIGFQYIWEGIWPDQPAYDEIHAAESYLATGEAVGNIFDAINAGQLYTRYVRVPVGGPGER